MARQILPIAGQIIGGMIGGPVGAAIGGAIGGAVGAYVDPIRHQGPKLGEARAQTAQEGVYRPLVFGTGCVAGNVIHRSPRKVVRHRESVGKGSRDTVDSDRGYRTFAIRIAEAHTPEGYTLLRIWENETLVYDVRPESEIPEESAEYAEKFRFYAGTEDQLPDPDLEAYLGVGNVNGYRGSCYIVFGNFDLTDYGDMVPQYRFEIASKGSFGTSLVYAAYSTESNNGILLTSSDGDVFDGSVDTGLGENIVSMFSAGGRLYVFGLSGACRTTANGHDFEDASGFHTAAVNDMAHADKVWVAVHHSGGISRSTDGVSFTVISVLSRTRICVAARGSTFIAGGSNITLTVSFDGGVSWTEYQLPVDGEPGNISVHDILDAGSYFIATKGSNYYRSASGAEDSWTSHSLSASPPVGGYALGGNNDYAMILGGGSTAVSSNGGASFSPGDWPPAGASTHRIASNRSGFFLGSTDNNAPLAFRSSSGQGWMGSTTEGNETIVEAVDHSVWIGQGERISLHEVISFCHRRVGMSLSSFDASALSDEIDGVVFADGYTARDAITTLLPIYNADASEHDRGSGYRINYIKRGAPVVRTLTVDDLVDEPEETVREDPLDRPRVLHMAFESPVTGYTAAKASIQRLSPDVKLVNEVSTYVPVTFKDVDEAWQRADVQMRVAWTEVHGERTFSISDDQLDVVPTDVLALSLRGQAQRLRVLKVEYADGVMKLETVADRQSNYTSHVTGIPLPAPEKPPPSLMGPAAFAILDIPAINDQHDRLGYYVAVCGTTEAYAGAVIQRQQNGEWADVVRLGRSQRAIMGVLESTVSAASEHYTDTTNTVSVALYMDDELESLSDAQWLSEGGAFALETESGWEVMQYRDAYQDSEGVWHLTHLARGRLNTAPAEHQPGSRFVLLDGVRFIDATAGMIGQPLTLRAAAVGRSPETAVPETITYQGNSQREFPVANLAAELDGSTLEMSAIPRDRFGTEQHPVRSANHDGFRWAATDGSATVTADSDHATASIDVSGLSAPITATVAQLNRFTGAGPTVSEQAE